MIALLVGIGTTVATLIIKTTICSWKKYKSLTPSMIASLNKINLNPNFNGEFKNYNFQFIKFPKQGFSEHLTEKESFLILGFEPKEVTNITKKKITDKYKKLILFNHPDRKGSQYLCQTIIRAKTLLEKNYKLKN